MQAMYVSEDEFTDSGSDVSLYDIGHEGVVPGPRPSLPSHPDAVDTADLHSSVILTSSSATSVSGRNQVMFDHKNSESRQPLTDSLLNTQEDNFKESLERQGQIPAIIVTSSDEVKHDSILFHKKGPLVSIPGEGIRYAFSASPPQSDGMALIAQNVHNNTDRLAVPEGDKGILTHQTESSIVSSRKEPIPRTGRAVTIPDHPKASVQRTGLAVTIPDQPKASVQKTGLAVAIPDHPKAKLVYYLHVVANLLGIDDPAVNTLADFHNYSMLGEEDLDALLGLAMLLNPDELIGKVMFLNTDMCEDSNNEFYGIDDLYRPLVENSSLVAGRQRRAKTIMTFNENWLEENYIRPMRYYLRRLQRLARGLPGRIPFKPAAFSKPFTRSLSKIDSEMPPSDPDTDEGPVTRSRASSNVSTMSGKSSTRPVGSESSCLCVIT